MSQKNDEKRGEILKYSYYLFSHNDYCSVFLKDIAAQVGISKSRLQNLYPKKREIMCDLLEEYIYQLFRYVEERLTVDINVYYKLALFTAFFWKVIDRNKELHYFMMNVITNNELLDVLTDFVFYWHSEMKYEGVHNFEIANLKQSLIFSISGGIALYIKKDSLNIETLYITQNISNTFMRMMDCSDEQISEVLKNAREWLPKMDVNSFLEYSRDNIAWMQT